MLTQDDWTTIFRKLFTPDPSKHAVLWGVDNALRVTASGTTVTIDTGAAFAYGFWYVNTSAVTKTLPSSLGGTTGHLIYLEVNWTARTVRIGQKQAPSGVATIPDTTKNIGSVYQVPLAGITLSQSGFPTVIDMRTYLEPAIRVTDAMIGERTISEAQASPGLVGTVTALLSKLWKEKLGLIGGILTGRITIKQNTQAVPQYFLESVAGVRVETNDGSVPAVGYAPFGGNGWEAAAHFYDKDTHFHIIRAGGLRSRMWDEHNDGAGSGLDADFVRGKAIVISPTRPTNPAPDTIRLW